MVCEELGLVGATLVILLFVVLAVACFGLLLPFLRLAVGIVLLAVRLLASLARSMGAGR